MTVCGLRNPVVSKLWDFSPASKYQRIMLLGSLLLKSSSHLLSGALVKGPWVMTERSLFMWVSSLTKKWKWTDQHCKLDRKRMAGNWGQPRLVWGLNHPVVKDKGAGISFCNIPREHYVNARLGWANLRPWLWEEPTNIMWNSIWRVLTVAKVRDL
jgi:hypothetical protein